MVTFGWEMFVPGILDLSLSLRIIADVAEGFVTSGVEVSDAAAVFVVFPDSAAL
jgi:hypothetical protein